MVKYVNYNKESAGRWKDDFDVVPEFIFDCGNKIAEEIDRVGFMTEQEVNDRIKELTGLDKVSPLDRDSISDIHTIIRLAGVMRNYTTGDFYTVEYVKEHPEVK